MKLKYNDYGSLASAHPYPFVKKKNNLFLCVLSSCQAGGMLVFFNSIIFVLLHLGVIGAVVSYGGRTVAFCLGTGPVESVVAVTNIFLGQVSYTSMISDIRVTVYKYDFSFSIRLISYSKGQKAKKMDAFVPNRTAYQNLFAWIKYSI